MEWNLKTGLSHLQVIYNPPSYASCQRIFTGTLHTMSLFLTFLTFFALTLAQIVPFNQPLPILTSPVVQAKAGKELYYQ
jgi:hypothetical protein